MGHRTPWPYEVSATPFPEHTQTTDSGPLFFFIQNHSHHFIHQKKEFDFLQVCFDLIILPFKIASEFTDSNRTQSLGHSSSFFP